MSSQQQNLRLQKWITVVSIVLLLAKFVAYYLTRSVAILSDALESIVNVTAGFIGLYSLYVSAKPRDKDHPYGHGKAEFISAAVEGTLIFSAAVIIMYNAIRHLIYNVPVTRLDEGMVLVAITAIINFFMGVVAVRQGKKTGSLAVTASGKHLQADSLTTAGVLIGLLFLFLTGKPWIDSVIAIIFSVILLYTGYKIIRRSIAGIMDEADITLLNRMITLLTANRKHNWVDLHNLRVIKYGTVLHVDCHLTVPWYFNVNEAHIEIEDLGALIRKEFGESLELFVHSDGCLYSQCAICMKNDCPVRQHQFVQTFPWSLNNILQDKKHEYTDLR